MGKDRITYDELILFDDEEFIRNVYYKLLKRAPDPEGFRYYLKLLKSGKRTKEDIITMIRSSKEGEKVGVNLVGFGRKRLKYVLSYMPIFGSFFKIIFSIVNLPNFINSLNLQLESISFELKKQKSEMLEIKNDYSLLKQNFKTSKKNKNLFVPSVYEVEVSYLNSAIETLKLFDLKFEKSEEHYYLMFENVFYNHFIVKEKQKIYLNYISGVKKWLDLGCGRGEFLEILTRQGIEAEGVEINSLECEFLRDRGYKVYNTDAISFLESIDTGTYDGISAIQVIEHMDLKDLKKMLQLIYEKLPKGGMVLIETVNPVANTGLGLFYVDVTHKKPIPSYTLAFLLEWLGFRDLKVIYSSPVPKEYQTSIMEKNYQDYAIIGYKK